MRERLAAPPRAVGSFWALGSSSRAMGTEEGSKTTSSSDKWWRPFLEESRVHARACDLAFFIESLADAEGEERLVGG